MKKININDVAREAGVSKATVSNVINDKGRFSDATKNKVLTAIDKLGFEVNIVAKSLAEGKSYVIGVMIPIYDGNGFFKDNLYFQDFLAGVNHYFTTEQRSLYDLIYTGVHVEEESCKTWIRKRNVDGVIVIGLLTPKFYDELKETGVPALIMDITLSQSKDFSHIYVDDEKGGYLGTKHLLENGHKNIAFVNGGLNLSDVEKRRYAGYKKAHQEFGVEVNETNIIETHICLEGGYSAAERIHKLSDNFSAAFVTSDIVAIGMIEKFKELGVDVPNDLSIVGFDDLSISKLISPKLTTVSQNIYEKGSLAGKTIIDIVEKKIEGNQNILYDVNLVVRDSVKRASPTD